MESHKKTILFIHHGKGLGGAPLSLLYLIQGLDTTKYQPIVVFLYPSEIIDLYKQNNIQTIGPLSVMDFPHTKIWWLRWYHVFTLVKAIKDLFETIFIVAPSLFDSIKPDLVHLNTSSLIGWAIAAHKKKIPVAWHIREPLAHGYFGIRKAFIQYCVQQYATAIIPISSNDARPWAANKKTTVLHNTVNPARFAPNLIAAQAFDVAPRLPLILFLGGLSKEKGTHIILEAFMRLKNSIPSAQLVIAGATDLSLPPSISIKNIFPATRFKKRVAQQVAALGQSVTLLGPITTVAEVMAASTVIVFPATVGHFARPIIEAGFMKRPVIASALPPLDELVIDGKTGFLVPPNDIDAWVEKLIALIKNQALNQAMGLEAHRFCTTSFGFEQYNKTIDSLYAHILKARGPNETQQS